MFNATMVDTSELLRVFGPFAQPKGEHHSGQVSGQRDTASADQREQVIRHLKQEIEHLNTFLLSKDSHIDSLNQAMLLLENHKAKLTESPAPWWKFWKNYYILHTSFVLRSPKTKNGKLKKKCYIFK
ncbi:hypothetical protein, partial [Klebsiella pneumoniae]|uniref:hypothetical protein n=1 Tax=Klebsiella pneumoniae TaxID=573 RepID=UPI001F4AA956